MGSLSLVHARAEVDRLTFEQFYAAEFPRVFDSAYALCRDRQVALDATQEAFARAFARWGRLRREDWAGGWVTTTALNVLKRGFRKAAREKTVTMGRVAQDASGEVDILDALRGLPWRQRQAATLFYVADLPVAAVAEAMDVSQGAVKAHLARARDHLRRVLEDRDV